MSESVQASMANVAAADTQSVAGDKDYLTVLNGDTGAYAFLEYFLRLSMQASTAKILSAWEVSNPQLTLQFEKRSKVQPPLLWARPDPCA